MGSLTANSGAAGWGGTINSDGSSNKEGGDQEFITNEDNFFRRDRLNFFATHAIHAMNNMIPIIMPAIPPSEIDEEELIIEREISVGGLVFCEMVVSLEVTGTVILLQDEDGKVVGTDTVDDKNEVVYASDDGN